MRDKESYYHKIGAPAGVTDLPEATEASDAVPLSQMEEALADIPLTLSGVVAADPRSLGDINFVGGFKPINVGNPVNAGDGVNKAYSDQQLLDAKAYADAIATDVLRYAGNWDASVGTFPTSGTGTSGAVRRGDVYDITIAGTIAGEVFEIGDSLRAMVNAPGQTTTNWSKGQVNTQQASETKIGIARIATNTEAIDALSDSLIMSPLKTDQKIVEEKKYVNYQVAMTGETEQAILMENSGNVYAVVSAGCSAIKLKINPDGTYPSGVQTYPFAYSAGDRVFFTFNYDDLMFAKCSIKFKCKDN